ncbi:MAG: hypothetical protein ACI4AB_06085 [Acetatifactor sp.]
MIRLQSEQDRFRYPVPSICAILALIYLSPFVSPWLNYVAFGLCIYRLVQYDERVFSVDYCSLISVATVFALPGGLSLVVVLSLIAVVWFVVRDGLVVDNALVSLLLLVCYLMLRMQSSLSDFVLCVSQLLIIYLMISFLDAQTIVLDIELFVLNVAVSSIYALLVRNSPAITNIIGTEVAAYFGSSLTRFQGLFRDPNYYMSLVIMSIVLLTLLNFKKYISKYLFLLGVGCMFLFGALTYSKTFLLLLCLYWLLCLIYLIRGKHYILAITFIAGTAFLAILLSNTLFATTLYRITSASSVSELTTGRSALFGTYFREILSSARVMLFGAGMSAAILEKGTHNLFLEIQYYIGLIGLILFFFYFGALVIWVHEMQTTGNMATRLFNYSSLIVFIALFCSLQGMFSISVYTLLYLAIISIGIPQNDCLQETRLFG